MGIRPPCEGDYAGPVRVNRTTNCPGSPGITDALRPCGLPMASASDTRPVSSSPRQVTSRGVPSRPTASFAAAYIGCHPEHADLLADEG